MKKTILILVAACFLLASCSTPLSSKSDNSPGDNIYYTYNPKDTIGNELYWELLRIDSIRAEYEQNLLAHNTSVKESLKEYIDESEEAQAEEMYSQACQAWFELLKLCAQRRFEEATQLYMDHETDYLMALGTSSSKFELDYYVGGMLLLDHLPRYEAWTRLSQIIEDDRFVTETVIAMGQDRSGYVPDHYPFLLQFLGQIYSAVGETEKAIELIEPVREAFYMVFGDDHEYIESEMEKYKRMIQIS